MISFIHYVSALRRLKESDKTVFMLGGPREAPPMILAQRDMIKHEVDYYRDEAIQLAGYIVIATIMGIAAFALLTQLGKI